MANNKYEEEKKEELCLILLQKNMDLKDVQEVLLHKSKNQKGC